MWRMNDVADVILFKSNLTFADLSGADTYKHVQPFTQIQAYTFTQTEIHFSLYK